jgi:sulfoquinovosyltransferase
VAIFVEPSPFSHVSGYQNRFKSMIKHMREEGDEVLVVTPQEKDEQPKTFLGARVLGVLGLKPPFYKMKTFFLSPGLSVRAFKMLWDMKPDVIHVSSPGFLVFAAILYAKLLAVPLVVSYHTHVPHYIPLYTFAFLVTPMWAVIRFCQWMADLTLVTSFQMKNTLVKEGGLKPGSIDVWKKGIDVDVFNPKFKSAEMREKMSNGHPEAPLLTYVGRLGSEKRLADFVYILKEIPEARLALVGGGPSEEELEELFEKEGLGDRVKFMGMMSGDALSQAYASASMFVMPSESETLGFVVIEAMSSGIPVVAVRAGGIPDLIKEGETGLMYTPKRLDECVAHIKALVADPERTQGMANIARKEVEQWGWRDSTLYLRNVQYEAAKKRNSMRKRNWRLLLRVGVAATFRRTLLGILRVIMGKQGKADDGEFDKTVKLAVGKKPIVPV